MSTNDKPDLVETLTALESQPLHGLNAQSLGSALRDGWVVETDIDPDTNEPPLTRAEYRSIGEANAANYRRCEAMRGEPEEADAVRLHDAVCRSNRRRLALEIAVALHRRAALSASQPQAPAAVQPKDARPVGGEALIERACEAQWEIARPFIRDRICAGRDPGEWSAQSEDCKAVSRLETEVAFRVFASHPTTGPAPTLTQSDDGVRDALDVRPQFGCPSAEPSIRMLIHAYYARHFSSAQADGLTGRYLATLSAPGSAGPGETTDTLVDRFATALKAKLCASEEKYGWQNGWLRTGWEADCQRDLARHVTKGDPLDVAAYAAFCWHHGWPTATPSPAGKPDTGVTGERVRHLKRGTEYEVLHEGVELQISSVDLMQRAYRLPEGAKLTIYCGKDGKVWAREDDEFRDGRFETITTAPKAETPPPAGQTAPAERGR